MQSECYDEDCSQSEASEAIENIQVKSSTKPEPQNSQLTTLFWKYRSSPCKMFDFCSTEGTEKCFDAKNSPDLKNEDFRCVCKPGYSGDVCSINCNNSEVSKTNYYSTLSDNASIIAKIFVKFSYQFFEGCKTSDNWSRAKISAFFDL